MKTSFCAFTGLATALALLPITKAQSGAEDCPVAAGPGVSEGHTGFMAEGSTSNPQSSQALRRGVFMVNTKPGDLFRVNVATRSVHHVGNMGLAFGDIAATPDGELYGVTMSHRTLYRIDPNSGATTHVASGMPYWANAMEFLSNDRCLMVTRDGTTYLVERGSWQTTQVGKYAEERLSHGDLAVGPRAAFAAVLLAGEAQLVTLDRETYEVTGIAIAPFVDAFGLDYGPDGRLYGIVNTGEFIQVDPAAGTVLNVLRIEGYGECWGMTALPRSIGIRQLTGRTGGGGCNGGCCAIDHRSPTINADGTWIAFSSCWNADELTGNLNADHSREIFHYDVLEDRIVQHSATVHSILTPWDLAGSVDLISAAGPLASMNEDGNTDLFLTPSGDGPPIEITRTEGPEVVAGVLPDSAQLEWGWIDLDGTTAKQVTLTGAYERPVVVCTPSYEAAAAPAVIRVFDVSGSVFSLQAEAVGETPIGAVRVHWLVVEEGYWEFGGGLRIEAHRYESGKVGSKVQWANQGDLQELQGQFTQPVVLGQVMSRRDSRVSYFWCCGPTVSSPPATGTLYTGKAVGEDPDLDREGETVGYVVIEAGSWELGEVPFCAWVSARSVKGMDDSPPYPVPYPTDFESPPAVALATQQGMRNGDGSWAVIYGEAAAAPSSVALALDEDQWTDLERSTRNCQVGYVVFGDAGHFDAGCPPVWYSADEAATVSNRQADASPDGRYVVWVSNRNIPTTDTPEGNNPDGNSEVFWQDVISGTTRQLTSSTLADEATAANGVNHWPRVSQDGSRVVFASAIGYGEASPAPVGYSLFLSEAGTVGSLTALPLDVVGDSPPFGMDRLGRLAVFACDQDPTGGNPDGNFELFALNIEDGGLTQLTETAAEVVNRRPLLSGDGKKAVFVSNADFGGRNPDGSEELWLLQLERDPNYPQEILQITQLETTPPATEGRHHWIDGCAPDEDASTVVVLTNADLTGSNPSNAYELFLVSFDWAPDASIRITDIDYQADRGLRLQWEPQGPSTTYTVEARTDLGAGSWKEVEPISQWPVVSSEWTDSSPHLDAHRYYRVRAGED